MIASDFYKRTISILESSDIVWGRYGTDTIEELALRIVQVQFPDFAPEQ